MPVLKDEFPVTPDFAIAFEEAEYLMALLQHNWHEASGQAGHRRWSNSTFHSGLIGIPGAVVGPQPESVASRFESRPGGLDLLSFTDMFTGGEEAMTNAVAALAQYIKGISFR